MKTIKKEFVKQYTEFLKPYGFKKIKGNQPYFVRVINNEIIHVISYYNVKTNPSEDKAFRIQAGVLTKYRKSFEIFDHPVSRTNWLIVDDDLLKKKESFFPEYDKYVQLGDDEYNDYNMEMVVSDSFKNAKRIIELLDEVDNMYKAFLFFLKYNFTEVNFDHILNEDEYTYDAESLYYVVQPKGYMIEIDNAFDIIKNDLVNSKWNANQKIQNKVSINQIIEWKNRIVNKISDFRNVEDHVNQGMNFLHQRISRNIDELRKMEIEIK